MQAEQVIVVIGASAGGVEAVSRLVAGLPRNFSGSVFITVHFPRQGTSSLPKILGRLTPLRVERATDQQSIEPGHIYVAPADQHLLLSPGKMRLSRGPTENGNRPAIDPMFRSASLAYGPRVIGVVLSGNLDDGTAGLLSIKRRGGTAVVQDPDDAMFPSMPASALANVEVDHVAALEELPDLLVRLVDEVSLRPEVPVSNHGEKDDESREDAFAEFDLNQIEHPERHPGEPSAFSCPDCGGVLWRDHDEVFERYRCRVGHAWTADALLNQQSAHLETALWTALRSLEESASLCEALAARMEARGLTRSAARFHDNARERRERAVVIRRVIVDPARAGATPDAQHAEQEAADAAKTATSGGI